MLGRKRLFAVMGVITALVLAVSASAQPKLPMDGQWFQNRGPLVDIPVNGGPQLCFGGNNPMTGCINLFQPLNGGIPKAAMQSVTIVSVGTTTNAPAGFRVPPYAFTQAAMISNTHVSIIPTVVQLDTHFALRGPAAETGGANVDRVFQENAWAVQGHSGRLALSFGWCPGVGGGPVGGAGECVDPRPAINGNPGPENGLVRYTNPGGNAFGGTMAMLLGATSTAGAVWVVVGSAGGVPLILRQGLGPPTPPPLPITPQHPGRGYATSDTDMLNPGPIFFGFMTSNQTALQTGLNGPRNGLITSLGPPAGSAPPDMNTNWGFPWTTGNVFVQDLQTNMGAMASTTISVSGTDNRTRGGVGTISLVAGGTSHRAGAVTDFKALDIVTMTLPEPGAALALGLSLSVIGLLYRLRRRF